MGFDFASAKALVRRTVQETFGVPAFYSDATVNVPVEIRARWHNRVNRPVGDLDAGGYAEIVEGIDRIVLIPTDCKTGQSVTLNRLGVVSFPSIPGEEFILEHKEPASGPLEEAWAVSRK